MAKQVTDREGATETVCSAAETHASRVQTGFAAQFSPFLQKGEKLPDLALALTLIARAQRAATADLVEKSDALDKELGDDAEPRELRDASTASLISTSVAIRAAVETVFGAPGLKLLGLDARTPTDPKQIFAHARKLQKQLASPKLKLPKSLQPAIKVSPKQWVKDLDKPLLTLTKALKDVAREEREAQAATDAKAKSLVDNDGLFTRGAGFISAALELTGDHDLAQRVRPSARRPGTTLASDTPPVAEPVK